MTRALSARIKRLSSAVERPDGRHSELLGYTYEMEPITWEDTSGRYWRIDADGTRERCRESDVPADYFTKVQVIWGEPCEQNSD
mgnify:CR=1 FL=1